MDAHRVGTFTHHGPDSPNMRLWGFAAFTRSPPSRIEPPTAETFGNEPHFLVLHRSEDPLGCVYASEILAIALRCAGVGVTFHATGEPDMVAGQSSRPRRCWTWS